LVDFRLKLPGEASPLSIRVNTAESPASGRNSSARSGTSDGRPELTDGLLRAVSPASS
jgi:hypothetical protein